MFVALGIQRAVWMHHIVIYDLSGSTVSFHITSWMAGFWKKIIEHKMCWVKRDQLDATYFIITLFSAQHVSDVNTSILRSLRLIRWVTSWVVLLWFDVCWCYVVVWLWWCGIDMQDEALVSDVNTSILRSLRLIRWVTSWVVLLSFDVCWCYVVVWLWWCGIHMLAEALVPQPAYGYHTTIATLQRNSNTHRTRYNPWSNSTN